MEEHPNKAYIDAASGRAFHYYESEVQSRIQNFSSALLGYQGDEFSFDRDELVSGAFPAKLEIKAGLGSMYLQAVRGLDGNRLCAWMVFSDEDIFSIPRQPRYLLTVKLGSEGWMGPHGFGYSDQFGHYSIVDVLREAHGAKLRLNTEFLNSIK